MEKDLQNIVRVIEECCTNKSSFDINIFDPTPEDTDRAWSILGEKYERHNTMQTDCLVTHLKAGDVCGYKVEIIMFRRREKGGDKK